MKTTCRNYYQQRPVVLPLSLFVKTGQTQMCLGMVGEDPVPTRFASVAVKQGLQPAVRQNHTDQVNVMAIVVFTHVIPLTYHMLYHSHITCPVHVKRSDG